MHSALGSAARDRLRDSFLDSGYLHLHIRDRAPLQNFQRVSEGRDPRTTAQVERLHLAVGEIHDWSISQRSIAGDSRRAIVVMHNDYAVARPIDIELYRVRACLERAAKRGERVLRNNV